MKILKKDPRSGEIKVRIQTEDDLWQLYNIVEQDDLAFALTNRREETKDDKLRAERGEKRKMYLGIRVETVEFHEFTDWLRIHGVIEEGQQDIGSYHTFNLSVGDDLAIIKVWRRELMDRLDEAERAVERPKISFVAIDDEEAVLAQLREYGIKEVAKIRSGGSGKQYSTKKSGKDEFYQEVLAKLEATAGEGAVIILGPGFEKENFSNFVREKGRPISKKFHLLSTGQSGMAAVQEVMKKGIGAEVLKESRVAIETKLMEDLLAEISKGGACAYGQTEVGQCLDAGAVETLLITDKAMRSRKHEKLLNKADEGGSKVVVISTLHDAGQKLESLGEVGALLRYKV